MSREIRVALLAIAALLLSYWGFNFIIGNSLFQQSNTYFVEYQSVGGLKTSTPVRINGVQIGRVAEVKNQLDKQNVLVQIDLEPSIKIPKATEAFILNETFMGQQAVELRYKTPCSSDDCAKSGDYIKGANLSVLASTISRDELSFYLEDFKTVFAQLIDTLNQKIMDPDANGALATTFKDLESTMSNLNGATGKLNRILGQSSSDITRTMDHVEALTGNLSDNNEKINKIISSTEAFTEQLSVIDLKTTVDELSSTLEALNATVAKADGTFSGLNKMVAGIENGEGSLGKFFKDPELYNEFSNLSAKADSLINDLQTRPYRYVPLKGRNRVKRYDRKDAKENN